MCSVATSEVPTTRAAPEAPATSAKVDTLAHARLLHGRLSSQLSTARSYKTP